MDHIRPTGSCVMKLVLAALTITNMYIFLNHSWKKISDEINKQLLWNSSIDFDSANINNVTGTANGCYIVPNYIHFIRFGIRKFTFVEMICVLAAFKNQKPDKIIFHRNYNTSFKGKYWQVLRKTKGFLDIIEFNYEPIPTEIFGQHIAIYNRKYHGSDITRIRALMKFGGIFLDNDSYLIRDLNAFRKYEMTLNWDENQYLGTQVLIAHKDARFLKLWLESYRGAYRTDLWYYNAGERPTKEILCKWPELVHRVKISFGADTGFINKVFQHRWDGWKTLHSIHLLIHHQYLLKNLSEHALFPVEFNEENIVYYPITFRDLVYDVYDIANITWPKAIKH